MIRRRSRNWRKKPPQVPDPLDWDGWDVAMAVVVAVGLALVLWGLAL